MAYIGKVRNSAGKDRGFRAEIKLAGFKPEYQCFKKRADAAIWAVTRENEIRQGRQRIEEIEKSFTAQQIIERYIKNVLPVKTAKKRSRMIQERQLKLWINEIGSYTLDNLTPSLITQIRDKLALNRKPGTVNRYLAALSHVFTIAYKEWQIIQDNPMKKVSMMREPRLRIRFLSDQERVEMLNEARKMDDVLYLFIIMALSTGARKNELLTLRWQDIEMDKNKATLHETKNDERRAVFFYGEAHEMMKERLSKRRKGFRYVFATRRIDEPLNIYPKWYRLTAKLKLKDFHIHDLRHCFATELARNGFSLKDIAEMLGHKNLNMVQRYAHMVESHASHVVKTMNEKLIIR